MPSYFPDVPVSLIGSQLSFGNTISRALVYVVRRYTRINARGHRRIGKTKCIIRVHISFKHLQGQRVKMLLTGWILNGKVTFH